MAVLIGVIAVTGRWPVDAPRTHLDPGGILSVPPERIARVEFWIGRQHDLFTRDAREGWLVNGTPPAAAVAGHIDTALRLLTVAAPRRVLSANEYGPDQLVDTASIRPAPCLPWLSPEATPREWLSARRHRRKMRNMPASSAGPKSICCRLLPRDVGEEWLLARNMAERAAADLLLPVSITEVWAIEIVSGGVLYRLERDPAGLWFHHKGQHVHLPGGFVHHADPAMAPLIEAELAGLDRSPIVRIVARHPDAPAVAGLGLEHPRAILLLYSRDSAGPVARIELGSSATDGSGRYARIQQNDVLATVPDDVPQHLATLVQLAGNPS